VLTELFLIYERENSFQQQIGLKFKKETSKVLHWSTALCGAETWTLRKVDEEYLESLKCGTGEEWRSV
jgi:hypothetical protein